MSTPKSEAQAMLDSHIDRIKSIMNKHPEAFQAGMLGENRDEYIALCGQVSHWHKITSMEKEIQRLQNKVDALVRAGDNMADNVFACRDVVINALQSCNRDTYSTKVIMDEICQINLDKWAEAKKSNP